ncbi:MAG: hypothetical protein ACOY0S_00365 [Patescibacteria group bacterium]
MKKIGKLFGAVFAIFLFGSLLASYSQDLRRDPFHIDEFEFVRRGIFFDLMFITKDFNHPEWFIPENYPLQPKLGPYIYGGVLWLVGVRDIKDQFRAYEAYKQGKTTAWHLWFRKEISQLDPEIKSAAELVVIGRRVSLGFTLMVFLLVFLLGWQVGGILCAAITVYLLAHNPLMFIYGRRAMTDSFLIFFLFANLFLVMFYVRLLKQAHRWSHLWLTSVLLGLTTAFAAAVKLTGILSYGFLLLQFGMLLAIYRRGFPKIKILMVNFLTATAVFLSVFIFLHPFLYQDTALKIYTMFASRLRVAREYQSVYPGTAVYSRSQALSLITKRVLLPGGDYTNIKLPVVPVDLLLFVVGLFSLGRKVAFEFRKSQTISLELILLTWTVFIIGSLIFYLQNDWDRYYLPAVSVVALVQAYALALSATSIFRRFLKR